MKKVLLTSSLLLAAFFSQAQCINGYNTTGLYDNYADAADPGNANGSGLYSWGEATLGGDANPNFQATFARNTGTGRIDYTVTQGKGEYVPFGISFGEDASNGNAPFTMDLSGNSTFSATFYNSHTKALNFRIAIQDLEGDVIDTYSEAGADVFSNAWMYPIQITVPAGGSGSFTSKTFAGGYYANYGNSTLEQNVDFTKIKGINITVIDAEQDAADGYKPYALSGVSVSLDVIQIGSCLTSIADASSISASKLFPNPATSEASIELELKATSDVKVVVSDVLGKEMMTVAEGSFSTLNKSFSVENLNNGVYNVTYYVNGAVAKTELLMKK